MRRHKALKKCLVSMLFIIVVILINNKVKAAGLTIKASKSTINEGDSVKITVSSEYTGRVDITASGGTLSDNKVWLENNEQSVTLKANSKDKIIVTATPPWKMANSSGGKVDVQSVSTTINIKSNNGDNNNNVDKPKEPTFKSVNETVYATGNTNIRKSYSTDSDIVGQLKPGDSVTRTGVGDNGWSKVTYNGTTGYIKSNLITTEEPPKSSDKALKTLEITPEGLDPQFDPETTVYTLTVGYEVEQLDIKAEPNDENATVEITGNDVLQLGDNTVKITVTAQDKTTRIYNINVKRQNKIELGLSSLQISGYTLNPKFSPSVYEYKINDVDSSVTKLDVIAEANDENAKVEISGNSNLQNGENTIIITVKSQDETENVIYQIYVNKTSMVGVTSNANNNKTKYIGIGIIAALIILIIILIIRWRRNSDYEEEEETEDYSDLYGYTSKNTDDNKEQESIKNITNNQESETIYNESSDLSSNENIYNQNNRDSPESLYTDSNVQTTNVIQKNEDTFGNNSYIPKDLYADYEYKKDSEDEKLNKNEYKSNESAEYLNKDLSIEQSGYSNEISNFGNTQNYNKMTEYNFEKDKSLIEMPDKSDEDYYANDNSYKTRRTKGKHSK